MSTYIAQVRDKLFDTPELVPLLSGGIRLFPDSGRKGLTRQQVVKAFSTVDGVLLPNCILSMQGDNFTGEAVDMATGYQSTKTPIYGWLYSTGDEGYDTIEAASILMQRKLQGFRLTGGYQVLWGNTIKYKREPLLEDACYYQFICYAYGHT